MVSVAGFGLSLDDLKWFAIVAFLALAFFNYIDDPNQDIIKMVDQKVFGYPVCHGSGGFCFAPAKAEIEEASLAAKVFTPIAWNDLNFLSSLNSLITAVWVLFKVVVCIMILAAPLSYIMKWNTFWFNMYRMNG
jgi:hypothetical protein